MTYEALKSARHRTVGTKQTTKAVEKDRALVVFVANDAEERVLRHLLELCRERQVRVVEVSDMATLGRACGVAVGTASAAILKDET